MSQGLSSSHVRLLGPWRRGWQWIVSLCILLLPFGHIGHIGQVSLLRLDFSSLSIEFFGTILRIEELYLLLIFSLILTLFFLLGTLFLGRVWCGWACPQTTLSDLAEWAARRLDLKIEAGRITGPFIRKLLLQAFFLFLGLLVGCNLLWYFITPRTFFDQISGAQLHPAALGFLLITATIIYLDLAFLRRLFCREFCPYGRFQTVLVDPATLTLSLPDSESARCIECGACVRACPMNIDIRRGYQIECINCGRCLDACRKVMHKRNEAGLIGYHFGSSNNSWRDLLSLRTLLLSIGFIGLAALLGATVMLRAEATLKLALSHQVSSRRMADDTQATFFNAWVNNRSASANTYQIKARNAQDDAPLPLKGPTRKIDLAAGENRKVDFVLISPFRKVDIQVTFELIDRSGKVLDSTKARITARQSRQ